MLEAMHFRSLQAKVVMVHAINAYGGVELHLFLDSTVDGEEWSTTNSCHFIPWERVSVAQRTGGFVGHRAGMDVCRRAKYLVIARI